MSAILDEFHALISRLEEEEHALAERFRAAFAALKGAVPALETEARADAAQVVRDAETQGVKPAAARAAADAGTLAREALADVETAVQGAAGAP